MARLWRNNPDTPGGKYAAVRRDGSVVDFAFFLFGERDPAAPAGLRGYAAEAERLGMDPLYVADLRAMADEWEKAYRDGTVPKGDPDAPRHRADDPATIERFFCVSKGA